MKTTQPENLRTLFRSRALVRALPRILTLPLTLGLVCLAHGQAINGTWTGTSNGGWNDTSKWSAGTVAGGAGSIADFSTVDIATTVTVNINAANAIVGTLKIGDTNDTNALQFTASGGFSLVFDNNGAGARLENVASASNTAITGPVLLADSVLVVNDKANASKFLDFRGNWSSQTAGLKVITISGNSAGRTTFNATTASISDGAGQIAVVQDSATSQLQLYSVNSYTGGTTIQNGGTVAITADSGLGAAASTLTFNNGTLTYAAASGAELARDVVLNAGGGLISISGNAVNATGTISGVGGLTKSGSPALTLSGVNTYAGGTTINQGNVLISADENLGAASGGVTLNGGNLQFAASLTSGRDIVTTSTTAGGFSTNAAAGNVVWTGDISGAGRINKSGSGTIHLQGTNTYEGGTFITNGTLRIDNDGNLGAAAGALSISASTLNIMSSTDSIRNVTLAGAANIATSYSSTTVNWDGNFSGTGSLTKRFAGSLVMNGNGSYTGGTTVEAGTLTVNGDFSNATGGYAVSAGRLVVGSSGKLSSSSAISVAAGGAFVYNNNADALVSSVSLAGNGLDNRAFLAGSGTIGSALALDNLGDTLAPGNSTGLLTFNTGQTWDSFSYDWEVNDFTGTSAGVAFDQIVIDGLLSLSATGSYQLNVLSLTASNLAGDVPNFSEVNREWNIISASGGIANFDVALWTLVTDGFTTADGYFGTFALNHVGNDLVLSYTAIPEPSTYALLGGALALGFVAWRRRRGVRA